MNNWDYTFIRIYKADSFYKNKKGNTLNELPFLSLNNLMR
jgi:hypothetical protein